LYLCYWMRQSGLADLLPSLRRETVYVGTSGGAMVATPNFGGETYDDSDPLTGSDRALGLVDFSLFPHLEREDMPDTSLANIEKWAAGLSVPAYAIDDQTAIKVIDGAVEVVSEGTGNCSPPRTESPRQMGSSDARPSVGLQRRHRLLRRSAGRAFCPFCPNYSGPQGRTRLQAGSNPARPTFQSSLPRRDRSGEPKEVLGVELRLDPP
jgi:Peptidase family S51